MKARFRINVEILDTDKTISSAGTILKMDNMEMDIVKMFDEGISFFPIKQYILKHYRIDKATYQDRFKLLLARLTTGDFIESRKIS